MRGFLIRLAVLALPFLAVAGVVARVDPFEYFPWSAGHHDPLGRDLAYRLNPPLWKLAALRHRPAPHLLLGDSRMAELDADRVAAAAGAPVANLAYGGGSLDEAMHTFWLADRQTRLQSATFGVNLDLYNESNAKDRVTAAEKILANPALYLCDRLVLRATWYDLTVRPGGKLPSLGVPQMSRDEFWRYQLDVTARVAYESYRYPEQYHRGLAAIADHCREKHIHLRFLVFPEHRDLVARAASYGLEGASARMLADLRSLGETIDLSDIVDRSDRANFTDPYHFAPAVTQRIIDRVWGETAAARLVK